MEHTDTYWMQQAIELARKAASEDEVPVGAVLVKDNQLISEGWNQPIQNNDPSAHAEITGKLSPDGYHALCDS